MKNFWPQFFMLVRVILLKQNFNFANSPLHMYVSLKHIRVLILSLFLGLTLSLAPLLSLSSSMHQQLLGLHLAWLGLARRLSKTYQTQHFAPIAHPLRLLFVLLLATAPIPFSEQGADRQPRKAQGRRHKNNINF